MDDGVLILKHQVMLLKVFLCIGGRRATDYSKALTASLAIWWQLSKLNHPAWTMFKHNPSTFNEECGEISFSALARQVARGGSRSTFKQSHKQFQLMRCCMQTAADFKFELNGPDVSQKNRRRIDPKGKDVEATAAFFRRIINNIQRRQFRVYDEELGRLGKGQSADVRPTVLLRDDVKLAFRRSAPLLDDFITKIESKFDTDYLSDHRDIWVDDDGQDDGIDPEDGVARALNFEAEVDSDSTIDMRSDDSDEHPIRPEKKQRVALASSLAVNRSVSAVGARSRAQKMAALVNRVVKVQANAFWPSREILKEVFAAPSRSFLHMRIARMELGHKKPFIARCVHPDPDDPMFELRFTHTQVKKLLVEVADEYHDTPFRPGQGW